MTNETVLHHVAVQCDTFEHAQSFFTRILNLKKKKSFTLDAEISQQIFSLNNPVTIVVFENDTMQIEVFITKEKTEPIGYGHLCLIVPEKNLFIQICQKEGLQPFKIIKGEKQLLFVHDFAGNLYEIKEKKLENNGERSLSATRFNIDKK